ncbi:short chain dehydrogenase [Alsobacter metallidurans]|uniref:Short chain dehydrogenase n=1 Tax=Alsobacter metallidurans TaxID=340221 RepID=A0A917MJS2_9HYPH|nr:SDR family oxidoreductase [Alsobacter metallidurans]GGH28571.1 short chain dehydrogenase [Alsobacter metallidurans]
MKRPVALVTGGARRIGAAIVRRLAEAGYDVAIHCGRSREDADALAADLGRTGARAAVLQADLAALAEVAAIITAANAALGPVSLLVNSASRFDGDALGGLDPVLWDAHFAVNLRAPVFLTEAFARQAPDGGDPSVVNLLDQRVLRPNPSFFSYSLTKSALHVATTTMAQALAPRIRVNGVAPGPTLANVHDGDDGLKREIAGVPLQHGVDPAEIADAVLYLARAPSVTGQTLAVDAGQHLGWRTPDFA